METNLILVAAFVIVLGVWYFGLRRAWIYSTVSDVLKNIIGAVLSVLCPLLYSLLVGKYPSFKEVIDEKTFTGLITFFIYLLFGLVAIYNVAKAAAYMAYKRFSSFK